MTHGVAKRIRRLLSQGLALAITFGTTASGCTSTPSQPENASASPPARTAMAAAAAVSSPAPLSAAVPWKCYFGTLHSHSSISDGVDSPDAAYRFARDEGKLDFLCLSEHNHMTDDAEITTVWNGATAEATTNFVPLVGQEFSTLPPSGGNHVNVYNLKNAIPATLNNNYRNLFTQWIPAYVAANPGAVVVCQFNHPERATKDYGLATIGGNPNYGGNWTQFVSDVDPWVSLIAVISGPADSNLSMATTPPKDAHRDTKDAYLRIWHTYLDRGFHLSPVADQDNHRRSWGTRTTARTGVWIQGTFDREALLQALKDGRTFAAEDKNFTVWFTLDEHPMGSRVADNPQALEANLEVRIEDADEPTSQYILEIYRDTVGDGELPTLFQTSETVSVGQNWQSAIAHTAGVHESFVVHVSQVGGNDDAWTAPIWIDPALSTDDGDEPGDDPTPTPTVMFMGSKKSKVYHLPNCKIVGDIKAENLESYSEAPAGKKLHQGCPKL